MGRSRSASPRWKAEGAHRSLPTAVSAFLYLTQGDLEPAIRVLEQGLSRCHTSGDRNWWRGIMAKLGYASALQGRLAEGRALLEETISESIRTDAVQGLAYRVAWLSEVCRLAGRGEEAGQHARQALDLAQQQKQRGFEALALYQLGAVHTHANPRITQISLLRNTCYSIQEKDCLINALKQPEPIRSAGCRVRGFLPVHW